MAIVLNNEGKRWLTYGDSNLYGVDASPLSNRWSALVSSESDGLDWNNGVSGQGWLNPGNLFVMSNIEQYNDTVHKYLILANGTNDIGVTENNTLIDGAPFKAKLLEIVDYAHNTKGWAYADIVLPTINVRIDAQNKPEQQAQFNLAIQEIAELRGCIYIDVYTAFNALPNISSMMNVDGVHYNNIGHRAIADIYLAADYTPYGEIIVEPTMVKLPFRIVTSLTPTEPVNAKFPNPAPLWLTNLQSPYQPTMDALFNEVDVRPDDYYGAMFFEAVTYQDFPVGQSLPIVERFEMGGHQGSHDPNYFRIFGVNNDESEDLLATYIEAGEYIVAQPKAYKRLKYSVRANARPNFIKIYGSFTPYVEPEITYTKYPIGNHMGTNIHPYSVLEDPNNPNERSHIFPSALDACVKMGRVRCYVDNVNISMTEDEYRFDIDRQGYAIDNMMQEFYDAGVYVVWCMQSMTEWLNATYPNQDNFERVPVEFGANRLDPASWAPYAEIGFQIALRYGSNPNNIPSSQSKSRTGLFYDSAPELGGWTKKVGLNILNEIEPYNEIDKWWKGLESYATGLEMAIGMNVIYQRIKDADPNMQVTYPGLASFNADILKEFVYHSMRLYNRVPVDNWAYHAYPSTTGGQYSGEAGRGSVPEMYGYPAQVNAFRKANFLRLLNKPFDCGEIGFDSSEFSPLRAVVPAGSGYSQREYAAICYLRVALFHAKNGIRATYHYQWNDLNIENQYTQFSIMGMTFTTGDAPNKVHTAFPNLFLLGGLRDLFGDYVHDLEVSTSPLIDKWLNGDGVAMYTAFMPTENNSTANYNLSLTTGTEVEIIELNFNSYTPTVTTQTVTGNTLTISCNEKPKFIKIITEGTPSTEDFDALMNSTFDFRAKATSSRVRGNNTVLATDGQEVGLIKDENGVYDIPYVGALVPNNTKKWPIFKKQFGYFTDPTKSLDFVFMENEANITYASAERTTGWPRSVCYVFYQPDYHVFEAYFNHYFHDYIGESTGRASTNNTMGTTPIRFTNGQDYMLGVQLNKNSVNCFITVMEDTLTGPENAGLIKLTFYFNGQLIGVTKTWKKTQTSEGFGADSNCEMNGFIEMGRTMRALSPTEVQTVSDALIERYEIGAPVKLPYATDVNFSRVGDIVTATYLYVSPTGSAQDHSKTRVTWSTDYTGGGVQAMETIHEVDNMLSFNAATLTPGKFIAGQNRSTRVNIYVEDVNGFGCLMPGVRIAGL